jgi:hypothetical protein
MQTVPNFSVQHSLLIYSRPVMDEIIAGWT